MIGVDKLETIDSESAGEVLPPKSPVGVNWATMLCEPSPSVLSVMLAVPILAAPAVTVCVEPILVEPSKNVTAPVGKAVPLAGVMVSVKVIGVNSGVGECGLAVTAEVVLIPVMV